jgi:hypothetical protein
VLWIRDILVDPDLALFVKWLSRCKQKIWKMLKAVLIPVPESGY